MSQLAAWQSSTIHRVKDIVIRVGSGSAAEIVTPAFRQSVQGLAATLQDAGYSVAIEEPERQPGHGLGFLTVAQEVGIFIGTGAATTLLNAVVTDIYNSAKSWAWSQLRKQRSSNPGLRPRLSFTLYDAEGKPLLSWTVQGDGEHEEDHRRIDPGPRQ